MRQESGEEVNFKEYLLYIRQNSVRNTKEEFDREERDFM